MRERDEEWWSERSKERKRERGGRKCERVIS